MHNSDRNVADMHHKWNKDCSTCCDDSLTSPGAIRACWNLPSQRFPHFVIIHCNADVRTDYCFYLWSENTPAQHSRASTAVIGRTISLPWILLQARYNSWPCSCKNGNVTLHSVFSVDCNYVYPLHCMITALICTRAALLDARKVVLPDIRVSPGKLQGTTVC